MKWLLVEKVDETHFIPASGAHEAVRSCPCHPRRVERGSDCGYHLHLRIVYRHQPLVGVK